MRPASVSESEPGTLSRAVSRLHEGSVTCSGVYQTSSAEIQLFDRCPVIFCTFLHKSRHERVSAKASVPRDMADRLSWNIPGFTAMADEFSANRQ